MKGVLYPYGYDEKLQFFNERYYNSPDNVLRFAKIHKIKYKMPEMQAKPHHSHGRWGWWLEDCLLPVWAHTLHGTRNLNSNQCDPLRYLGILYWTNMSSILLVDRAHFFSFSVQNNPPRIRHQNHKKFHSPNPPLSFPLKNRLWTAELRQNSSLVIFVGLLTTHYLGVILNIKTKEMKPLEVVCSFRLQNQG